MNYIARVSNTLSNSIINSGDFQTLEKLKIRYGIECIVSELSKFIIYLLIFSLFSLTNEFIIATLFFSLFRIYSGGFHQNTYLKCLITSFLILLIVIKLPVLIHFSLEIKFILLTITYILTFIYSPVDNHNKRIKSMKQRKKIKSFSIIILIVINFISLFLNPELSNISISALFIQSITLPIGKIHQENL